MRRNSALQGRMRTAAGAGRFFTGLGEAMLGIPEAAMARYRATAREREAMRDAALALRLERCLGVARVAAEHLRSHFRVRRVVLFGSLARGGPVSWRSDVDLAVWGLAAEAYFAAVGQLQALDPSVSVDVVRVEEASPALLAVVDREGVSL